MGVNKISCIMIEVFCIKFCIRNDESFECICGYMDFVL